MHPGFIHWWKEAQRQAQQSQGKGCEAGASWSGRRSQRRERVVDDEMSASGEGDGGFGVRRPLRFMAFKLELNETQVEALAGILADLKTERAQAAVDHRRSVGVFADALAAEAFDAAAAAAAAETRVKTAQLLRDAVLKALAKTHALLDPEQRKALAYLLRSGQLTI